jgi:hydroxymethylbilane synthase
VHSAKDLPSATVPGLTLAAIPERGDARDALAGGRFDALAAGATVGTGSARRRVQLAVRRPDLTFVEIRGNMAKRLSRLDDLDAVVVAAVALTRLGLDEHLADVFAPDVVVPQVGQGALAVECRVDDDHVQAQVAAIDHAPSRRRVDAERAFLATLGGDCTMPAGAHAVIGDDGRIQLTGVLAATLDAPLHRARRVESVDGADPRAIGSMLAEDLAREVSAADPAREAR